MSLTQLFSGGIQHIQFFYDQGSKMRLDVSP